MVHDNTLNLETVRVIRQFNYFPVLWFDQVHSILTYWLYTMVKYVSVTNNVKAMAGGCTVPAQQVALLAVTVVPHMISMASLEELAPRGVWQ